MFRAPHHTNRRQLWGGLQAEPAMQTVAPIPMPAHTPLLHALQAAARDVAATIAELSIHGDEQQYLARVVAQWHAEQAEAAGLPARKSLIQLDRLLSAGDLDRQREIVTQLLSSWIERLTWPGLEMFCGHTSGWDAPAAITNVLSAAADPERSLRELIGLALAADIVHAVSYDDRSQPFPALCTCPEVCTLYRRVLAADPFCWIRRDAMRRWHTEYRHGGTHMPADWLLARNRMRDVLLIATRTRRSLRTEPVVRPARKRHPPLAPIGTLSQVVATRPYISARAWEVVRCELLGAGADRQPMIDDASVTRQIRQSCDKAGVPRWSLTRLREARDRLLREATPEELAELLQGPKSP